MIFNDLRFVFDVITWIFLFIKIINVKNVPKSCSNLIELMFLLFFSLVLLKIIVYLELNLLLIKLSFHKSIHCESFASMFF